MGAIRLNVPRALWLAGREYRAGELIHADDADALALVEAGRVELADPRDRERLQVHARDVLRRVMQRAGQTPLPAGDPWQRVWPR